MYIVADVLARVKSFDPDDLIKGIEGTTYTGVTGLIEFSKTNHDIIMGPGRPTNYYAQWQNGKQVFLYPERVKTGDFVYPPWIEK
jgi:branched-chain amino acid transport system substrate-binding protein